MGSNRAAYPPAIRPFVAPPYYSSAGQPWYAPQALQPNNVSGYGDHLGGVVGGFKNAPFTDTRYPFGLLRSDVQYGGGYPSILHTRLLPANVAPGPAFTLPGYGARVVSPVQNPFVPSNPPDVAMAFYSQSSYFNPSVLPTHPRSHLQIRPEQIHSAALMEIRKRKASYIDSLIKETWDLHSLHRAGLAAAPHAADISYGSFTANKKQDRKAADGWHTVDGGGWMVSPSKESEEDTTWGTSVKVLSPPKELDDNQEQLAAKLQRSACEKVVKFMVSTFDNDDDDSDEEAYVSDNDDVPDVVVPLSQDAKSREEQAYDAFLNVFEENKELQKLYNEQCHVGKFECLVCSTIRGKPIKKYPGLVSVVMHANKIIRTKKKQEHRGFARAVCMLLGWDICRMPTVPLGSSPDPRCCIPGDDGEENKKSGTGVLKKDGEPEAGKVENHADEIRKEDGEREEENHEEPEEGKEKNNEEPEGKEENHAD